MEHEVLIAIVTAAGFAITAVINGFFSRKKSSKDAMVISRHKEKIDDLHSVIKVSTSPVAIDEFMLFYHTAIHFIDELAERDSNSIDRVMVFKATNGVAKPENTTCIHEYRKNHGRSFPYKHLAITPDYVDMLGRLKTLPYIKITTARLDETALLKNLYTLEGVVESLVIHLVTKARGEKSEIYYMSFATHKKSGITETDITESLLAAGQLRNFMARF